MRAFVRTTSAFTRVAERRVPGKQVGNAILSTKMLHQIKDGNMVPRAAPAPMPTQPQQWQVQVTGRGVNGEITKLRIQNESQLEVPAMAGASKAPAPMPKSWTVKVTKRDEMQLIRELHITPGKPEEK